MTANEQLYAAAIRAITDLFSDLSVGPEEAVRNLNALKDEIDILIGTLE